MMELMTSLSVSVTLCLSFCVCVCEFVRVFMCVCMYVYCVWACLYIYLSIHVSIFYLSPGVVSAAILTPISLRALRNVSERLYTKAQRAMCDIAIQAA